MAINYVDESKTGGANDGTSWTDAWLTIAQSESVAAGIEVHVASTHDELSGSAYNTDWSNGTNASPVKIISVLSGSTTYTPGARIGTSNNANNFTIAGSVDMYGMVLEATLSSVVLNDDTVENQKYVDCTITCGTSGGDVLAFAGSYAECLLENCTINIGEKITTSQGDISKVRFVNCDIVKVGSGTILITLLEQASIWEFEGCDLSDWDTLVSVVEQRVCLHIRQCSLKGSYTLYSGTIQDGNHLLVERSDAIAGHSTQAMGLQELIQFEGTIKSDTGRFRTGGADTGETSQTHSWEMVCTSNSLEFYKPLCSPWGVRWVAGGSAITLTFYVASGVTLQDDEFWIELITPDETATSTTQADFRTSLLGSDKSAGDPPDPLATPANLTTDSGSTWNGSGVGTKQEISFTFTPDIPGPVKFRACLAKVAGVTCYFDPKVAVT